MKIDLHTHYYPPSYFELIKDSSADFSYDTDPTGRTIIKHKGARFFGITPPMTDPEKRIEAMDRVGIDIEVVSLSTPNVLFTDPPRQTEIARRMNDEYAALVATYPTRFKAFASIPMEDSEASLVELHRAIDDLKLNGAIMLSNIRGKPLTAPEFRPFFEEANRMQLCIFLHPMLPAQSDAFNEFVLGPLVGFPFDTTLAVARMCFSGMLRDFPDIRWSIGHLGGAIPYLMERLDSGFCDFAECQQYIDEPPSTYLKRLHYDTVSFSLYSLRLARDLVGTDHMVMGSDFPHMLSSIEKSVSSIDELTIPEQEKEQIFSGTALRILNNV